MFLLMQKLVQVSQPNVEHVVKQFIELEDRKKSSRKISINAKWR